MKCPYCGKEIKDGAQACPYCWKDIPQDALINITQEIQTMRTDMVLTKPDSLPENLTAIWELPDAELASAYHSSAVLRHIGLFFYLCPLFSILFIFSSVWLSLVLCAFYILMLYPIAYVLRNIRNYKAQKRLIHIAVFTGICGGISIVILFIRMLFIEEAYQGGTLAGSILFIIIYTVIWLYVYRHAKNKIIFSDNPCSHAELQFVKENRNNLVESANFSYPEKYTYGKIAKTAMFFSPLVYLLSISLNISFVKDSWTVDKSKRATEISQEQIKYAEECVKQGDEAAEAKDFQKAFVYYEKAADLGHPLARLNLGVFYAEGLAGTTDCVKAFDLLSNKDIIVSPVAKYYIGLFYYTGEGTTQDFKKAAHYLLASAEAGYEPAQKWLGYENGKKPDMTRPLEEILEEHWKNVHK